ncbi:hypothetical protein TNCT_548321 [Trichonephila clavata]|uniref:Uncharacterized protein n=1 Tax=Trichonephila clavata TaxID=2740835 RepID=A0A8X6JWX4_TRICU|nr:hypothetical protein TNCT_548321 [Trichonephila clavata]
MDLKPKLRAICRRFNDGDDGKEFERELALNLDPSLSVCKLSPSPLFSFVEQSWNFSGQETRLTTKPSTYSTNSQTRPIYEPQMIYSRSALLLGWDLDSNLRIYKNNICPKSMADRSATAVSLMFE